MAWPCCCNSAGELTHAEIEEIQNVLKNPRHYKIPEWFLNRRKDIVTGKTSQIYSNQLIAKLRDDLEGLKRIRCVVSLARLVWLCVCACVCVSVCVLTLVVVSSLFS